MPSELSFFETPLQRIELRGLPGSGKIIDVGGGGEGLVSRIGGTQVCAVDIDMNKIREAQIHGLSSQLLLAAAQTLPVKDSSFDMATLWFSLGFMRDWPAKEQVVDEVARVLKPEGLISILGATIDCSEDRFVLKGEFSFPDGTISQMSYGVAGRQNQTMECITEILKRAGFGSLSGEDNTYWFRIDGRKQ